MNAWLIVGVLWGLGMVLGWAFIHGAAKLRSEDESALASAAFSAEYDIAGSCALEMEGEPTSEPVRALAQRA